MRSCRVSYHAVMAILRTAKYATVNDVTGRSAPKLSFCIAFKEFKSLADIRPLLRLFRKLPLHEAHEGARFGARLSPGRKHRPKFGRRQ